MPSRQRIPGTRISRMVLAIGNVDRESWERNPRNRERNQGEKSNTNMSTIFPRVKHVQVANKLLQILSQIVSELCSHCLFHVVATSLIKAVNNL